MEIELILRMGERKFNCFKQRNFNRHFIHSHTYLHYLGIDGDESRLLSSLTVKKELDEHFFKEKKIAAKSVHLMFMFGESVQRKCKRIPSLEYPPHHIPLICIEQPWHLCHFVILQLIFC